VSAQCLFDLLQSLEGETADILDILELVKAEKPLKSLGKCTTSLDILLLVAILKLNGAVLYIK
jgi:hypothetical protein